MEMRCWFTYFLRGPMITQLELWMAEAFLSTIKAHHWRPRPSIRRQHIKTSTPLSNCKEIRPLLCPRGLADCKGLQTSETLKPGTRQSRYSGTDRDLWFCKTPILAPYLLVVREACLKIWASWQIIQKNTVGPILFEIGLKPSRMTNTWSSDRRATRSLFPFHHVHIGREKE